MDDIMEIALYVSEQYNTPVQTFMRAGNHQSDAKHVFRAILKEYIPYQEVLKQLNIQRTSLNYSHNICKTAKFRKSERYKKMYRVAFLEATTKSITVYYDANECKAYMSEPEGVITQKIQLIFNNFNK